MSNNTKDGTDQPVVDDDGKVVQLPQNWKEQLKWKDEYMSSALKEESSFATLFPQYREQYLREVWPTVTRELQKHGIKCELNCVEGSMTVSTTRKTKDPYIIVKARDLLKLLARSIPVQQALRILEDDVQCDIIKIGGLVRNKDRFVKRRQRIVGPNGATLKAIELLTECYVLVQGNTVAVMGPWNGLRAVRKIVIDCMNNVHPIYRIKELMIKRELAKDERLKNENWERFLPKYKKKNVHKKASAEKKKKYTPFPPENHFTPSKLDKQLESGEYFLTKAQKKSREQHESAMASADKMEQKRAEREAAYVAPKEESRKRRVKDAEDVKSNPAVSDHSVQRLKQKFKKFKASEATSSAARSSNFVDYVEPSVSVGKKKQGQNKKQ